MSFSFLTLLLVAFTAFLALLGLLSMAVTKTVNPDGQGTRGCFGGCASAMAILFLCGMGMAGLGTFVLASAVGTAIDKNPIERIEIRRAPGPEGPEDERSGAVSDGRHGPVHVLFTVRGKAGAELVELMKEVVEVDDARLEDYVTVYDRAASDGSPYQIVEFRLPISERDLDELEHDIEHELDGLRVRLPESVVIDFEGVERFY